jgi:hypothetical protein
MKMTIATRMRAKKIVNNAIATFQDVFESKSVSVVELT